MPRFGLSGLRHAWGVIAALALSLAVLPLHDVAAAAPGTWQLTANMAGFRFGHSATLLDNGNVLVVGGGGNPDAELYLAASGRWTATGTPILSDRCQHTATRLPGDRVLLAGGAQGCEFTTASAEIYTAASGTFAATGSMTQARAGHTATLLPDGTVLVAGGLDTNGTPTTSAELFNPTSGTWSTTGSMHVARASHHAALLSSGKVLVVGGVTTGQMTATELYDPHTRTWTNTASLHNALSSEDAELLQDGRVIAFGSTAELYDTAANTWTPTGSPLFNPAVSALLHNGALLVLGCCQIGEFYDPQTGTWAPTADPQLPGGTGSTLTVLANGTALSAGGQIPFTSNGTNTAELYTPTTGIVLPPLFKPTGAPRLGHIGATLTLMTDGRVLLAGGLDATSRAILGEADLFNPATGKWTVTGSLVQPRSNHTATLLANGHVLVAGGFASTGALATAEEYDPTTGRWASVGSMHTARADQSATLLPDGRVLVVGGGANGDGVCCAPALVSTEVFDPIAKTWSAAAPLLLASDGHRAVLLNTGRVLVAGGTPANGGILDESQLYDPFTNTWSSAPAPPGIGIEAVAALLPDGRALFGGGNPCPQGCGHDVFIPPAPAQIFDAASEHWTPTGIPSQGAGGSPNVVLSDGSVLGGLERFDPTTGAWTPTEGPSFVDAVAPLTSGAAVAEGFNQVGAIAPLAAVFPALGPRQPISCTLALAGTDPITHAAFIRVAARDVASGLASVSVTGATNSAVAMPKFPSGFQDPAVVVATKIDQKQKSTLALRVTNIDGQSLSCDPIVAQLSRGEHQRPVEIFDDVARADSAVVVANGDPGLQRIDVFVNSGHFRLEDLRANETRRLDVSSAMHNDPHNRIVLVGHGRNDTSAVVVIGN